MTSEVPVDAVCVGCGDTHIVRAPLERLRADVDEPENMAEIRALEARDFVSFKTRCNACGEQWHNATAVLKGMLPAPEAVDD